MAQWCRDGAVVRALASHQCGPGSIPGLGVICGLSLLFVLVPAVRGFSSGTPVFPSPPKQGCHGQGKVREFCKRSGKILVVVKVSEKSGNFIFRLRNPVKSVKRSKTNRRILMAYKRS